MQNDELEDILIAQIHGIDACDYCQSLKPRFSKYYGEVKREGAWVGCTKCCIKILDFIKNLKG